VVGDYANKDDIDSFQSLDFIIQETMARKMTSTVMPVLDATFKYMNKHNHTIDNQISLHNCFAYIIKYNLRVPKNKFQFKDIMVFGSNFVDEPSYILIQDMNLVCKNIYIREINNRQLSSGGFVRRPSIIFYKDNNFNMKYNKNSTVKPNIYGDSRDMGHVLSYEANISVCEKGQINMSRDNIEIIDHGKCDNSLYYIRQFQNALKHMQCLDMIVNYGETYDY